MDVEVAKAKKYEFEEAIMAACVKFHAETGLTVKTVNVELVATGAHPPMGVYRAKASVML